MDVKENIQDHQYDSIPTTEKPNKKKKQDWLKGRTSLKNAQKEVRKQL